MHTVRVYEYESNFSFPSIGNDGYPKLVDTQDPCQEMIGVDKLVVMRRLSDVGSEMSDVRFNVGYLDPSYALKRLLVAATWS